MHAFLSSADFFFKINFFERFFQEYHQIVKQFGSRSPRRFVGSDFGLNCLQRLSADDTRSQDYDNSCKLFDTLIVFLKKRFAKK